MKTSAGITITLKVEALDTIENVKTKISRCKLQPKSYQHLVLDFSKNITLEFGTLDTIENVKAKIIYHFSNPLSNVTAMVSAAVKSL